jgi:hypothetical protein
VTHSLRNLHQRIVRILLIAVPAAFLVTIAGYQPAVYGELPEFLRLELPESAIAQADEESEFDGLPIRVELFTVPPSNESFSARRWVRITLLESLREPDVIVYWSTRASTYDRPPLGAQMLGVLDDRKSCAFPLPTQASFLGGRVVLFSVGQQVMVAQVPLPSPL